MRIAPVAEVKACFGAYLKQCADGPISITRYGRPAAVLVAAPDEEGPERLVLAHAPRSQRQLEAARERIQETCGVEDDDFWESVEEKNTLSTDS